ncbi:RidA family protein [uncultured Hymenobacter sp.]|uniref:RidA family protein n=1 Tax=uncultured Hymenobacter sp. TaxID=170016 RepID=UPI0035CABCA9
MEKRVSNPWLWQEKVGYAQAVEVKQPACTLYCAGQAALDAEGQPSTGDLKTQVVQVIQNVEQVLHHAGYQCRDIVRLNVYTTSAAELFGCFDIFTDWVTKHGIQQASTLVEVKGLAYESLKIEMEVTAAK